MKKLLFLVIMGLVFSCGGDDGPPPAPEAALLVFPDENSECTTGVEVSTSTSRVEFQWQPSVNTDSYVLNVTNLETSESLSPVTTANTSASVTIAKGAPFSWSVTSRNERSEETATSERWLFYNSGIQTTYAPFPAQLIAPGSGSTVIANDTGEITLAWLGADVEDDIQSYEVYFSSENPPVALVATTDSETTQFDIAVTSGTIYYWRVVTTDLEGNTSDSGVFDFRTL